MLSMIKRREQHIGFVKQKGIVLLMLVIIITLAFISYSVSNLSINDIRVKNSVRTQLALKQAKSALINYAVTHMNRTGDEGEMGFLPCPDVDNASALVEGAQESPCGTTYENSLGYFPWVSLDSPVLKDSSGTCLMYAVSNTYKLNPTNLLNDDSNGMFQVVDSAGAVRGGDLPEDRFVAIVFAPGKPLPQIGQARTFDANTNCGDDYNFTNFLEGTGAINNGALTVGDNVVDQFIHKLSGSAIEEPLYNDKFITISKNEIWSAITEKNNFEKKMEYLTEALAKCMALYSQLSSNRRLPWPAQLNLNGQNYRINVSYNDDNGAIYAGRYPFKVDDSSTLLGVSEGQDYLFEYGGLGQCDNIAVGSTGDVADLQSADSEYRKLWENWKDHFFYAISKDYEPGSTGEAVCGSNCITVKGPKRHAGVVIFSGVKLDTDVRDDVFSDGGIDNKADVLNYIENGNEAIFPVANGSDSYSEVGPSSNDIMFCITDELAGDDLTVEPCL